MRFGRLFLFFGFGLLPLSVLSFDQELAEDGIIFRTDLVEPSKVIRWVKVDARRRLYIDSNGIGYRAPVNEVYFRVPGHEKEGTTFAYSETKGPDFLTETPIQHTTNVEQVVAVYSNRYNYKEVLETERHFYKYPSKNIFHEQPNHRLIGRKVIGLGDKYFERGVVQRVFSDQSIQLESGSSFHSIKWFVPVESSWIGKKVLVGHDIEGTLWGQQRWRWGTITEVFNNGGIMADDRSYHPPRLFRLPQEDSALAGEFVWVRPPHRAEKTLDETSHEFDDRSVWTERNGLLDVNQRQRPFPTPIGKLALGHLRNPVWMSKKLCERALFLLERPLEKHDREKEAEDRRSMKVRDLDDSLITTRRMKRKYPHKNRAK